MNAELETIVCIVTDTVGLARAHVRGRHIVIQVQPVLSNLVSDLFASFRMLPEVNVILVDAICRTEDQKWNQAPGAQKALGGMGTGGHTSDRCILMLSGPGRQRNYAPYATPR